MQRCKIKRKRIKLGEEAGEGKGELETVSYLTKRQLREYIYLIRSTISLIAWEP